MYTGLKNQKNPLTFLIGENFIVQHDTKSSLDARLPESRQSGWNIRNVYHVKYTLIQNTRIYIIMIYHMHTNLEKHNMGLVCGIYACQLYWTRMLNYGSGMNYSES